MNIRISQSAFQLQLILELQFCVALMQKTKSQPQKYPQEYHNYLDFFENNIARKHDILTHISKQKLQFHSISVLDDSVKFDQQLAKFEDCYIGIRKSHYYGLIYIYDVIIGHFYFRIKLLNLQRTSDQRDDQVQNMLIGCGGFGTVRAVYIQDKQFAIKRIHFKLKIDQKESLEFQNERAENCQIRRSIRQYCIYKICSMLQIGPKIVFNNTFDLICFSDCIQFSMELCQSPFKRITLCKQKQIQPQQFQKDMKNCLFVLHQIKFIHKDIKPQNVLYSSSANKFVLADFGMTHTVCEQIWQKSFTSYEGTLQYSSQEMLELYMKNQKGYANLYQNDVHSLKLVIQEFYKNCQYQPQSYESRNSMSFAESFSEKISFENYESQKQLQYNQEEFISQTQQNLYFQSNAFGTNNSSNQINTGSSFPQLSTYQTNSMQGPDKYASQINFYEAEVIHIICKQYLERFMAQLTLQKLNDIVNKVCQNAKLSKIKSEVHEQILVLFYPSFSNQQDHFQMMNIRNISRNYGPYSQEALYAVEDYVQFLKIGSKRSQFQRYKHILSYLKNGRPLVQKNIQKDLKISLLLKNYRCCMDIGLFQVSESLKKDVISQQKIKHIISTYIQLIQNDSVLLRDQINLNKLYTKFINKFCAKFQINYKQALIKAQISNKQALIKANQQLIKANQQIYTVKFAQDKTKQKLVNNIQIACTDKSEAEQALLHQLFYECRQQQKANNFIQSNLLSQICQNINVQNDTLENLLLSYRIIYSNQKQSNIQIISQFFFYLHKKQYIKKPNKKFMEILEIQIYSPLKNIQQLVQQKQFIEKYTKLFFIYCKVIQINKLDKQQNNIQSQTSKNHQIKVKKALEIIIKLKQLAIKVDKKQIFTYSRLLQNQIIVQVSLFNTIKVQSLCQELINYSKDNIFKRQMAILFSLKAKGYMRLKQLKFNQAEQYYCLAVQKMLQNSVYQQKPDALLQCFNNLVYIYYQQLEKEKFQKLSLKIFEFVKKYQNKEKHLCYTCYCIVKFAIQMQLVTWNLEANTLNDQFLRQTLQAIVKVSIKVIFKYSIIATKGTNTINNIQFNILKMFDFRYFLSKYHEQIMFVNKFLSHLYLKYLPLTQWLYRNANLNIAEYLFSVEKQVQGLSYLWIYLQKLFQNMLMARQSDYILMNMFVSALFSQNSTGKALFYLKKYMFHIPLSMFSIRQTALILYLKIAKKISLNQLKYLKKMAQNDYHIMKFRKYDQLIQFEDNQQGRIKNILLKKWIRKW